MVPVLFQTPAALLLLAGGLLSCFAGYRVFRTVLGIYGFFLGALLASSIPGFEQTWALVIAAIVGGAIGALILIAAYFIGVALIGAGIGAFAANIVAAGLGREPHIAAVILLSVLGAVAALSVQRYVIIVATAFAGAQTAIVGAVALLGDRVSNPTVARHVYAVYPIDPLPWTQWDLVAMIVLGVIGLAVQLGVTAKGR